MGFCAQKKLEKAKKVMYTALQQPGITLSTESNRVCLAKATLRRLLRPVEAQRCVKRLGSSVEIETSMGRASRLPPCGVKRLGSSVEIETLR